MAVLPLLLALAAAQQSMPVHPDEVQVCGRMASAGGVPALVRADGTVVVPFDGEEGAARRRTVDALLVGGMREGATYCLRMEGPREARVPTSAFELSCLGRNGGFW